LGDSFLSILGPFQVSQLQSLSPFSRLLNCIHCTDPPGHVGSFRHCRPPDPTATPYRRPLASTTQLFGGFGHINCLTGNSTYISRGPIKPSTTYLVCGVPQVSMLGPTLFVLYPIALIALIESYGQSSHLYAADTQV